MLKDLISKQKEQKERLLLLPYIKRNKIDQADKWNKSGLIKVILGPRRAGKSVLAFMLLKSQEFIYLNFDDERLFGFKDLDYDEMMAELHAIYGPTKNILFDEIQNLPRWELFANRLLRSGYNLVLTGSNALLLGRELATALTGRHIPIEIMPFDFKEFLLANKYDYKSDDIALRYALLEKFLRRGSFPELVMKDLEPNGYLDILFDSLLFKDVVQRHKIRFMEPMAALASYLINNITSSYTARSLSKTLDFKSDVTLEKYLSYLLESYLFFSISAYSHKFGQRRKSPRKIYAVDNGLISAKSLQFSKDSGRLMKNLVFTELIKKGLKPDHNIFYYKTKNAKEVDFLIKDDLKVTQLIQVAYNLDDPKTMKRELSAIVEAAKELNVTELQIVSWNRKETVKINNFSVNIIPLWSWLLDQ